MRQTKAIGWMLAVGLGALSACGGDGDPEGSAGAPSAGPGGSEGSGGSAQGGAGGVGGGAAGGAGGDGAGGSGDLALEVVVEGLAAPFAIAVAGSELFFSDSSDATIKRCDIEDCKATIATYAQGHVVRINAMRAMGDDLYWATDEGALRAPMNDGSEPELLAAGDMRALAVDASGTYAYDKSLERVVRVPPGQAPVVIAEGAIDVRHLVVSDGIVYFPTYGINPAEAGVFACSTAGCGTSPTPLDGGGIGVGVASVAVEGSDLVWAEVGAIKHCPKEGCSTPPSAQLASSESYELLTLLDGIAFVGSFSGMLHRCAIDDCEATRSSAVVGSIPQGMDWDDDYVYVIASSGPDDGRIVRTAR